MSAAGLGDESGWNQGFLEGEEWEIKLDRQVGLEKAAQCHAKAPGLDPHRLSQWGWQHSRPGLSRQKKRSLVFSCSKPISPVSLARL